MSSTYLEKRERNNRAASVSRLRAVGLHSPASYVLSHPDLSGEERAAAKRFLAWEEDVSLTEPTKAVLRRHLVAARKRSRNHCSGLLARLDG